MIIHKDLNILILFVMPHDMIDEYFEIYTNSIREYGEKTCVLYACGSFYEVYKVENKKEVIGNADVIAEIIRCDFSNKNKSKRLEEGSTRAFPDFCGFGIPYLPKYLTPLLENNYTVVIVDQLESSTERKGKLVKRGVVAVHSPCFKSPDYETYLDTEFNLLNLFFEIILPENRDGVLLYSICSVNNITNQIEINENIVQFNKNEFKIHLDDITKILSRYNIREIRTYVKCNKNTCESTCNETNGTCACNYINILKKFLDELYVPTGKFNIILENSSKEFITYKEYNKRSVQSEYFKRVYKHINFGLIDPLEYLSLLDKPLSTINLMYTIDYISAHDLKYINNLSVPNIIEESVNLTLELNTLQQLNIFHNETKINKRGMVSSIFDVVNYTTTAIGRRHLKGLLAKPFRNSSEIEFRYNLTNELFSMKDTEILDIEKLLKSIIDFERLHRKMSLDALHPYEFEKLHNTYINISNLFESLKTPYLQKLIPNNDILFEFSEYITSYKKSFDILKMKRIGLNTSKEDFVNFFNDGVVSDLDKIQNEIYKLEDSIEQLRKAYDNSINEKAKDIQMVKLGFTDNDGYFFSCTKVRYQKILKDYKEAAVNFTMRQTSNMCKFHTEELVQLSNKLINQRDLLVKKVKLHYINRLQEYSKKYFNVFKYLSQSVAIIDVSLSNMKCSKKNKYCKPIVHHNSDSFFIANELRHPIIELINDNTEYIPNDVKLTKDSLGMLVYGLNSSGKSSLLRSIGVSIILAQAGLYTPCKSLEYAPFHTIISQVDLTDNLFANKSSFTNEMCGLKKILSSSHSHTLVLSDELCRGTEINSSCAIVASTLLHLVNKNTKFFFTTHIHNLCDIPEIKSLTKEKTSQPKINVCHLSVETNERTGDIIFERRLKPGSGSNLYGLEVCKSIIQDKRFIDLAFDIRNGIISNNSSIVDTKRSRYNKKKITDVCEICGFKPKPNQIPLDTHHINEQRSCDENGFVIDKHFHKNKSYNLVSLCKTCHLKIDTGKLIINGYKTSTSGTFLDYKLYD
jgi:DNA mismatch repair protein MutS